MVKDINESELREYIKNSLKPIVIDFYAPWCGPCKTSEPLVSEFAEKNSGSTDFYKINVDSNPDMTGEYEIRNIPTFILLEGGEVKNKLVGSPTKEKLEKLISEYKSN
jgi:thioredoxin 1